MQTIADPEFGEITVVRQALSSRVSIRMTPNGQLRINLPRHVPTMAAKTLLVTSRKQIRKLIFDHQENFSYTTDQQIGKSHHLRIEYGGDSPKVKTTGTHIVASIPDSENILKPDIQQLIRAKIVSALRKEAKSYLPRRLKYLADQYGFSYDQVKLTHASSRWGSCSSRGTISLNIALMNLPFELLDYVLIHELSHTRHMNHSDQFWREVAKYDPDYKQHRNQLKKHTPQI